MGVSTKTCVWILQGSEEEEDDDDEVVGVVLGGPWCIIVHE